MANRYQVDFYAWVGEHGHTGDNLQSLQTAFESAKEFLAQEKKGGSIKEYGYIGVDGGSSNDFAIVFMTEEYLKNTSERDFKSEVAYKNWMDIAQKVLKTGKPQKGNYSKEVMGKGGEAGLSILKGLEIGRSHWWSPKDVSKITNVSFYGGQKYPYTVETKSYKLKFPANEMRGLIAGNSGLDDNGVKYEIIREDDDDYLPVIIPMNFEKGGITAQNPEKHEKGGKITGDLNGRKITKLSYPAKFGEVWGRTPMALHLDNGAMLIPVSDYEQNDAGAWLMGDKTFGVTRGGESKEQVAKLIKNASKYLVGKKIVEVDKLDEKKMGELGWDKNSMVLVLNNGSALFTSKDDEGTDGGALFLVKGEDWISISEKQPKGTKKEKGGVTAQATNSGISWIITGTYI